MYDPVRDVFLNLFLGALSLLAGVWVLAAWLEYRRDVQPEPVRTDPGAEARRAFEASARPGSPDTSEDYWPGAA